MHILLVSDCPYLTQAQMSDLLYYYICHRASNQNSEGRNVDIYCPELLGDNKQYQKIKFAKTLDSAIKKLLKTRSNDTDTILYKFITLDDIISISKKYNNIVYAYYHNAEHSTNYAYSGYREISSIYRDINIPTMHFGVDRSMSIEAIKYLGDRYL